MTAANDDLEPAPDIVLGGFRLRIFGYVSPDTCDDYDWLDAEAECVASGAHVVVRGPFLTAQDLSHLTTSLKAAHALMARQGSAETLENKLKLSWEVSARGGFRLSVSITPDDLHQRHEFIFDLDLSYLDATLAQCCSVLARYPVRSPGDAR